MVMATKTTDKVHLCEGCRNNFYNQAGNSTTGRCWSMENAKVVTRYRLGWWTQPTQPGAYAKVTTLSCHHAPGQYALHEELPDFITSEERNRIAKG
jgi:hypothetical protein